MGFCRPTGVTGWLGKCFKTLEFWFDCQGDRGDWSLWFLKCRTVWDFARPTGVTGWLGLWGVTLKHFKLWNFWFDCQGDRGSRSLWFLKRSLVAKLSVRVSPKRYLLTWGLTVDTDQGDWCSWLQGWLDLFFKLQQSIWSRKVVKKRP